jgi:DNA-binding transcriptional MerR regulator
MKNGGKFERRGPEVKRQALERMRTTNNISNLARELGIPRRTLYLWRDKELARIEARKKKANSRKQQLEREVAQLKEALGQASLDVDFFKGALQRIWDRRPPNSAAGESASTRKFEK